MISISHKTQQESVSLTNRIAELSHYIQSEGEFNAVTIKPRGRNRKGYQDGGTRICVTTADRKYEEASYRMKAKTQVMKACNDPDFIVDNILNAQPWAWRW